MRSRSSGPRLLAALLSATWAALALVLLAKPYGTGLADPLLALSAFAPAVLAAGAAWRPPNDTGRAWPGVAWLGATALFVAVPFAVLIAAPIVSGDARPVVPSAEVAYAGLLAVLATSIYAAVGWFERGRQPMNARPARRYVQAGLVGVCLACAVALTAVAGLSARALDLTGVPGDCGAPQVGAYASVTIDARAEVDGATIATASARGDRSGPDERWSGDVTGATIENRTFEYVLLDGVARLRSEGSAWQTFEEPDGLGHVDRRVAALLAEPDGPVAEDLGVDILDGTPARHCHVSIDGPRALRAFLPAGWLLGREALDHEPALPVWRGDLDWWTFADGLGRARMLIGGHPSDAWGGSGLRGTLRAELRAMERDVPRTIAEPLP